MSDNTSNIAAIAGPIRVLMTGAGAPGAAGIIKCLQQDPQVELITADANPDSAGHYLSKQFIRIPLADDPLFTETLLALCREKNIHVVLPLVTRELMHFANHLHEYEMAGTRVIISQPASLEIAINKSR